MAALKYIREQKDSHLLSLGVVEGGETVLYTVNAETYEAVGSPAPRCHLTESQLSAIKYTDSLIRAKKKALSLLAFSDNNRRTLMTKLLRAGFSREISESVVSEMVALGYVNEERQLERIILDEANRKLRGAGKIIPALTAKGYSSTDVRSVLSRLVQEGQIDFKENAKTLIAKKLPEDADPEEKKKLLFKNGYKI